MIFTRVKRASEKAHLARAGFEPIILVTLTLYYLTKYHKDSKTPDGNLEFQYIDRDIGLKSTSIE